MDLIDYNLIQIKLIRESNLDPFTWIEKYSKKFREIIEKNIIEIKDIKRYLYNQEEKSCQK
ncbi:MAG: hypothetical protein PWP46_539 [Fusobacteriaceae bacterium]|jgi:hypothetical protein|nr:hypothetical protein [Fusobacteriales bacterium]MDN5303660.1 hypothetical protein [Fusobacteriaceae bacterium]